MVHFHVCHVHMKKKNTQCILGFLEGEGKKYKKITSIKFISQQFPIFQPYSFVMVINQGAHVYFSFSQATLA